MDKEIILKEGESRKQYLVRVACALLRRNAYSLPTIKYDEADCDAFCLAADLETEFNLEIQE